MIARFLAALARAFGRARRPAAPTAPPLPENPPDPPMPLPENPPIPPDPPTGRGEMWDFARKNYDQTWRIRFPSALAREHGIGPGSYCIVNGRDRASFRSYDRDHGAMRPSYTMPLAVRIEFPATVVLYRADGRAVAWFRADRPNQSGRLP